MIHILIRSLWENVPKKPFANNIDYLPFVVNKKKYFNEALKILGLKKLKINQDISVKRGELRFNLKENTEEITLENYLRRKFTI